MQSLWIFQLSKNIEDAAGESLKAELETRLQNWKSHQDAVESNVQLQDNRFIIIESFSDTSGCSKDFLRKEVETVCAEQGYALDEATVIAYRDDQTGEVLTLPLTEFTAKLQDGSLTPETMIYDLTVVHENTLDGLLKWVSDSWMAKYLPVVS